MPKLAAVWPGKVEVQEKDLPPLKDDQILVRIERSGICGTDYHVFEKGYGPHRICGEVGYPLYLGHEYVGVIEKKGKDADKMTYYHTETPEEGDRVYWGLDHYCYTCAFETYYDFQQWCLGAFFYGFDNTPFHGAWSQYVIIDPGTHMWKLPKEITPEMGVVIEPYIVGLRAVDKVFTVIPVTSEKEGVAQLGLYAIYGAGAIGLAILTALRNQLPDATIVVADPNKYRLDTAKKLGADHTLDIRETSQEERIKFFKDLVSVADRPKLGSRWGVDVAFDATGKHADLVVPEIVEIMRPGGVFDEVGAFTPYTAGKFTVDPNDICSRELVFTGSWAYHLSTIDKGTKQVIGGLFKRIPYHEVVTNTVPLDDEAIMKEIRDGLSGVGIKHIIDPWL